MIECREEADMERGEYVRTRLRAKGQMTLPSEVRELLSVSEGDDLVFSIDENGRIVVERAQFIPPDQAWFWSDRWQEMERRVQEDIAAGRIQHYKSVEDAIADLELGDAGDRSS
jgi:AbrB family looped-hinge helix DNA binding protein